MEHDCAKNWYLIQFKPNSHQIAARNLIRQGFEIFLPLQEITKRKDTKFTNVLRPLFPGYMFVSFAPETAPFPHYKRIDFAALHHCLGK
jgi:transcriptional antiterminator RfaH